MNNAANLGMIADPEQLKYVTENFGRLQGLKLIVLGAWLLFLRIDNVYGKGWRTYEGYLYLVAFAVLIAIAFYIPRYYRLRFGWVEHQKPNVSNKQIVIFVSVIVVLFLVNYSVGHSIDSTFSTFYHSIHLMISDPTNQVDLIALQWSIMLFFFSIRWHPKRIDIHNMISYFFCILMCGLIALYPQWHPYVTRLTLWKVLNAGSFGISLIALGLYDHFTLIRLMPKRISESDSE